MKSLMNLVRKPLALLGLVAGVTMGTVGSASAVDYQFSYSTASATVTGFFSTLIDGGCCDEIVSVSGLRNGLAITGLWYSQPGIEGSDNYLYPAGGVAVPGTAGVNQMDLHYLVGSDKYVLHIVENYFPSNLATEATADGPSYPYHDLCDAQTTPGCQEVTQYSVSEVPEINASAGLQALALLLAFGLIFRELFQRRRGLAA